MSSDRPRSPGDPHELLVSSAAALARGATTGDGPAELLRIAAASLGAARAVLYARDPEGEGLAVVAARGFGPDDPPPPDAAASAAANAAAMTGTPTLGRPTTTGAAAGMAADLPLVVARGGIELRLGAVTFFWDGARALDDGDRALMGGFADLLAVALDQSRLASLVEARADRAERLALMDGLTGLANARTLDRVLELEVARAGRQGSEVSVALFDIDGFAALNERAGRQTGDVALREVAAALAGSVRLVDTVARTGGDEFVVVAPGSAGRTVARRIVEAVADLPPQGGTRVSISAGVARFPTDGASAEELLDAARAALWTARGAGGGRIFGGDGVEPA